METFNFAIFSENQNSLKLVPIDNKVYVIVITLYQVYALAAIPGIPYIHYMHATTFTST